MAQKRDFSVHRGQSARGRKLTKMLEGLKSQTKLFQISLSESLTVNGSLLHLVAENALGGAEKFLGAGAGAARGLERIQYQVPFICADRRVKRQTRDGAALGSGLQRRRQVMPVNNMAIADRK